VNIDPFRRKAAVTTDSTMPFFVFPRLRAFVGIGPLFVIAKKHGAPSRGPEAFEFFFGCGRIDAGIDPGIRQDKQFRFDPGPEAFISPCPCRNPEQNIRAEFQDRFDFIDIGIGRKGFSSGTKSKTILRAFSLRVKGLLENITIEACPKCFIPIIASAHCRIQFVKL
jgi:hypothetical protein